MEAQDFTSINQVIIYALGAFVIGVSTHSKHIIEWLKDFDFHPSKTIIASNKINDLIWGVVMETGPIHRIGVFRAGNGGSKPRIGKPMKVTMLYNSYDDPIRNKKEDYNELEVDHLYIKNLSVLAENKGTFKPLKLVVDKMDKSDLKTIYESEEVLYSELYFITESKKYMYYVSIATASENEFFDDSQVRNRVTMTVNHLIRLFTKRIID